MPEISFRQGDRGGAGVATRSADPLERRVDRLEVEMQKKLAEQTIVSWRYAPRPLHPSDSWWGGLLYLVGVVLAVWAALHYSGHEQLIGRSVEKALAQSRAIDDMTQTLQAELVMLHRNGDLARAAREKNANTPARRQAAPTTTQSPVGAAGNMDVLSVGTLERLSERLATLAAFHATYPFFILVFGVFLFLLLTFALSIVIQIVSDMTKLLMGALIAVVEVGEKIGGGALRYVRVGLTGARDLIGLAFEILQTSKSVFLFVFLGVPIFDLMQRANGTDATMAGFYYHAIGLDFTDFLKLAVKSVFG